MKLKVQMIGVDLDGTLLTTDKKLLPYTASVLKAAAGQGRCFACYRPSAVRCTGGTAGAPRDTVCDFGKRREDRGPEGGEAPA